MIPDWLVTVLDALAAGTLLGSLILVATRGKACGSPARLLLTAIVGFAFVVAMGNVVEWSGVAPQADIMEDFFSPLMPTLWLFVFLLMLERTDRDHIRHGYDRLTAIQHLALQLTVTMEPDRIMNEAAEAAQRLLDAPYAVIFTPEAGQTYLVARAVWGLPPGEKPNLIAPIGEGITGCAFINSHPCRSDDAAEDVAAVTAPLVQRYGITNVVGVPLLFQNRPVGVLTVARTGHRPFTDEDVALLETLCAHAAVAVENARLYERLSESEEKYRMLVESAQVAIVPVDADRRILSWNHGAEQLFGWRADEVLGRHISLIYPEEKRQDVVHDILPILHRNGSWVGEYPNVRKDGSRFTAFLSLTRLFDSRRNVVCTLGVITDVTESVRLRDQLYQAQKMQTIGTLAAGIAHDFNNLLTAVLGFASLLEQSLPKDTEDYDSALSIQQAAQRGTKLVRQLMTFGHKQPAHPEPVNLNDLVVETADLIGRTFPRNVTLTTRLTADLHPMRADPTHLHQILMNLAVNARDAMPNGGALTITTENTVIEADDRLLPRLQAGPGVVLTVSDTGQGIDLKAQPHVFEPFFTTKPQSGGTGLGLSTVYALVTQQGGRVTFQSEPGMGTTFRIVMPAMIDDG